MNWGKGIIIAMSLFIGIITFLVVILMSHRIDLESEDYYQREIDYEQEINAMQNSNAFGQRVELLSQKNYVVVQLPEKDELKNVEIRFIRPDDNEQDKSYRINGTRSYLIPKTELIKGTYQIEISFEHQSKPCLQKESIVI